MGNFTATQIVNDKVPVSVVGSLTNLPVEEQRAFDWALVVPKAGNYYASNFDLKRWAAKMDAFVHLYSTTAGGVIKFPFHGRRVGIMVTKGTTYGKLAFDVDGTAYGTLDCANTDNNYFNVPYIIATDLTDGDHTLTITKLDANANGIQGFLVDTASYAQNFVRAATDYHASLDSGNTGPINIGTTDTTLMGIDTWLYGATITNTTASPINVTLKNNAGTAIIGPFPVPANNIFEISGPRFFSLGMKAIASATGCFISWGGQ